MEVAGRTLVSFSEANGKKILGCIFKIAMVTSKKSTCEFK